MFLQAAKGGMGGDYAPLLAALVELGEGQAVSSDNISRIRSLLASLREKIQDSVALLTDNENKSIAEFGVRKERILGVIALLGNSQGQLSAYIAQM